MRARETVPDNGASCAQNPDAGKPACHALPRIPLHLWDDYRCGLERDHEGDHRAISKERLRWPDEPEDATADYDFTHDDYTRSLVSWRTAIETPDHLRPAALDMERRMRLWLHRTKFGCLPKQCPKCQDEAYVMRVLDCDENGNPNDA